MSAFVLVLAHSLRRTGGSLGQPRTSQFDAFLNSSVRLAPYFIGISLLAFGVEHFLWPDEKTAKIPFGFQAAYR